MDQHPPSAVQPQRFNLASIMDFFEGVLSFDEGNSGQKEITDIGQKISEVI